MKEKIFCEYCGEKLKEGKCPHCDNQEFKKERINYMDEETEHNEIEENFDNSNEANYKKRLIDLFLNTARYLIGCLFIVESFLNDYPHFYSFIGILFGLSLFPIFYQKLKEHINLYDNNIFLRISIILPIILFITWIMLLPKNDDNYNLNSNTDSSNSNNSYIEEEKNIEEELEIEAKKHLFTGAKIESLDINNINKYDLKIKYEKELMSEYVCASDTQSYAKNLIGNENINSIQFECVNNTGTFYYVKVDNIYDLKDEITLNNNTKYYSANYIEVNTNIPTLKEKEKDDFKNGCGTYSYKDVLRNPNDYKNKKTYWFGEIVQVVSKTSYYSVFRVNVSCTKYSYIDGYSCPDTLYVTYYRDESFIEDDIVKMWGLMDGTVTYTTVLGASVTVPSFNASYIELQN